MCRVSLQEVDGLPLAVVEHVRDLLFGGGPEPLTVRQHQVRHTHVRAGARASAGAARPSALSWLQVLSSKNITCLGKMLKY